MKNSEKIRILIDHLHRGEVKIVRQGVNDLLKAKLDRRSSYLLAHCARRSASPEKAIRLLHPYVRESSHGKIRKDALPHEISEYAICLGELGASKEALTLLALVPLNEVPASGIHTVLTHIRLWDWASAEVKLKEMLNHPAIDPLNMAAAKVFMGSCLLHGKMDFVEASKYLKETTAELDTTTYGMLQRSSRLLRAQALVLNGEWKEAEAILLHLREAAEKHGTHDTFELTNKWLALSGLMRDGLREDHLNRLAHARSRLLELKLWERVRGCDYYLARINQDPSLITRLRAGTPYPAFQERMNKIFGNNKANHYIWDVPGEQSEKRKSQDPLDMKIDMKKGQVSQRLLHALASDFYRPFKLVELHELVFTGEHFNPDSSVLKLHKSISRLRSWFKEEGLSMNVEVKGDSYSLTSSSHGQIKVPIGVSEADHARSMVIKAIADIARHFPTDFSMQDAAKIWNVSRPTAVRYLTEAVDHGLIERKFKGKNTKYFIKAV